MSETAGKKRRDRLEAMLPFFRDGTLSGAELREVEEWLASDAEARALLRDSDAGTGAEGASAADAARTTDAEGAASEAASADAAARFARALAGGTNTRRRRRAAFRDRLPALPIQAAWAAAALALAVLVGQTVWIGLGERPNRIAAGAASEQGPFAFVLFAETAAMTDISAALEDLNLTISAGPLADGHYRVSVPVGTAAAYRARLAALEETGLAASVVAGAPPKAE